MGTGVGVATAAQAGRHNIKIREKQFLRMLSFL
jgi:hypothetical protein